MPTWIDTPVPAFAGRTGGGALSPPKPMTTLPSRIRSPREAYEILEGDLSQRKRELINLQGEIGSRRRTPVILKSAVLLAYAHVEGAVKAGLSVLLIRLNS